MAQQPLPGGVPLPAGMEPFPSLGADVVGTRPRMIWVIFVWFAAALMVGLAVLFGSILLGPRSNSGAMIAVIVCLVVAAAIAWLALSMAKPILIVDGEAVRTLAVLGRGSIALASITQLRLGPAGRSLVVDAEGGITTGGKLGKKKWITISNIHIYRVAPGDLVNYLAARARASHLA